MRFDMSQQMRLGQHLKLAPRMIQSMEILQMPLTQLEERIEQELESNPTLEVAETHVDPRRTRLEMRQRRREEREEERPLEVDERGGTPDFARLEAFEQANPEAIEEEHPVPQARTPADDGRVPHRRAPAGEDEDLPDAVAAAPARAPSLVEQLQEQWRLADVPEDLRAAGELLLTYVEDDGYLRTPLETIVRQAPEAPDVGVLTRALTALQTVLDPPGVCARDLRECLLLQIAALERDGERTDRQALAVARRLLTDHMDDLVRNRLPRIAEKAGLSLEAIKAGVDQIRRLSLAPGRRLVEEREPPVVPDAIVEYDAEQGRYVAYLNDARLPNLRINRRYAEMVRDRHLPRKDRDFLRTNLSNAQWLIDAIGQRRHTLLRVIHAVLEHQRDFFDFGPQALRPLPMTQVAEELGIHVATVSRAVADKYLLTPRGIVPLRRFFTGGLPTDSGQEVSYDAVRAALSEIVAAEDKSRPLSDEALVEELKKRGIEIARRTVAKYRDQMGIPSARLRRAY